MNINETNEWMYNFKHLPAFALFILQNHLDEYISEQIDYSFKLDVPLLKLFKHLTREEIFKISKGSNTEILTALAENKAKKFHETSIQKWISNQHEIVGKFDLVAEDITLTNHVRQHSLQKFIPKYTDSPQKILELVEEISAYILGNNTSGTNAYINILTGELQRKTEQLLEAQRIAQVGSFEWDFKTINRDNSEELRRIFETEKAQSYEEMLERVHPDDREKVRTQVANSLAAGFYDCEFRYRINGKEKVLWTKAVLQYAEGKPVSMAGTVQDVTERKKIEQNLLQKTRELELSNANLEKFAFIASHDLQEPLRKILIHSDLLTAEKENLSQNGKVLIDKISTSTKKMKRLINDILAYSTIHQTAEKQPVSLEEILDDVKNELENEITKTRAVITSDGLPEAVVYTTQMKQLFQNLIGNAIKFSKKDSTPVINITHQCIETTYEAEKTETCKALKIILTDNGIGFNNEQGEEIFSVFKRLHSQKEYEGSGLGLAICKKVIDNHNGTIEATGEPGRGATFTIVIPVEQ